MVLTVRVIPLLAGLLLVAACGGDGQSRICFSTGGDFCDDLFGRNEPPRADAGPNLEVVAGDRVELDGRDSDDRDGRIDSYSWTQRSGTTVALEDAGEAVARFTAPDTPARINLRFRLVVTDDEGAGDDDEVTVTVLPLEVAALRAGVVLLKTVHHPLADDPARLPADRLGLWLGARIAAAQAGADPEIDVLLDELRVVQQSLPAAVTVAATDRLALFRLGQQRVAAFTAPRDPGTAELALLQVPGAWPATMEDWRNAIRKAHPELDWFQNAPAARSRAARLLLAPAEQAPAAAAVAAAVLLLASRPDAEATP